MLFVTYVGNVNIFIMYTPNITFYKVTYFISLGKINCF